MTVACARCGTERDRIAFQPFPNETGKRIYDQICAVCWGEWLNYQKQLINHYALNLLDPKAKQFLMNNMKQFLFKEDADSGTRDEGLPLVPEP